MPFSLSAAATSTAASRNSGRPQPPEFHFYVAHPASSAAARFSPPLLWCFESRRRPIATAGATRSENEFQAELNLAHLRGGRGNSPYIGIQVSSRIAKDNI